VLCLEAWADRIILSPPERRELQRMSGSRSVRSEDTRRARIILSVASGSLSLWAISRLARCSINTVRVWRDRSKEQRLPGLWSRHRGRAPSQGIEKHEARIIDWTLHRKPADGSTHWEQPPAGLRAWH
jgi:transposase